MLRRLRFFSVLLVLLLHAGLVWAAEEVFTDTYPWGLTELTGAGGTNPAIVTVPRFDDQGGTRVLTEVQVELRGDLSTGGDPNDNPPVEDPPTNTGYTTPGTLTNTAAQQQSFQFTVSAGLFQAEALAGAPAALATVELVPSGTVLLQEFYAGVPAGGSVTWGPKTLNSTTLTQTFSSPAELAQFVGSASFGYSATTLIGQSLLGGGGNVAADVNTAARFEIKVTYTYDCAGTIGDFVWIDQNRNGLQDAGEPGIAGVTVLLVNADGTIAQTAVTNGNGFYQFSGVCPNITYTVQVDPNTVPDGFTPTTIGSSNGNDLVPDDSNDPAGTTVQLPTTEGASNNPTVDFGYVPPCEGTIGDFVWIDQNRNGLQDAGEPGITNVTVLLIAPDGTIAQTAVTNGNGAYQFNGVCPFVPYTVQVDPNTLPADFTPTIIGSDDGNDLVPNDSNDPDGTTVQLPTSTGENANPTVDFGYVPPCDGTIGDFVWIDQNRNGLQDAGEPGITSVTVRLIAADGTIAQTAVTNGSGFYQFSGVCPFIPYTVVVDSSTVPTGFTPTIIGSANGNDLVPDDSNDPNGTFVELPTSTGENANPTVDFGYVPPCDGTIGDFVWNDQNRNGLQDADEPGIASVTVRLINVATGEVAQTAITDGSGFYQFSGVCSFITYKVQVDPNTVPAGFTPTPSSIGNNNGDDLVPDDSNDPNGTLVELPTIDGDNANPTVDFGYVPPCDGTIGDFVWVDQNRNGLQDAGEPGIASVTVRLINVATGEVAQTAITDGNGAYQFSGVCPFVPYTVQVDPSTVPAGFTPTTIGSSNGNDLVPNDSNDPAGTTVQLPTSTGANDNPTVDFGYLPPCVGTIGDFVWNDLNQNGLQDPGEPGIEGVTVQLFDALNQIVQTDITDESGAYRFEGICPFIPYTVKVTGGVPAGFTPTTIGSADGNDLVPNDSNDPNGTAVTLPTFDPASPDDNLTVDFGYVAPPCTGSIGDFVWEDSNRNGVQDLGEPGIADVKVELFDSAGNVVAIAVTDANGFYEFAGLCAGSYTVRVDATTVPDGFSPTEPLSGNGNDGNNADSNNPAGTAVTLPTDNTANPTVDFGYVPPCTGSIGDFVWDDLNQNGIQEAGEPGIQGVTVELLDSAGNVVAIAVTDANGFYQFERLCAGTYTVVVTTPAGFLPTPSLQGGDPAKDSNGSPALVSLPTDDSSDQTIDFGFFRAMPAIDIEKATNGEDADSPTGPVVYVGSTVTWTYVVTNVGNVELVNVVVTDDQIGDVCTIGTLAVSASETCTATGTATEGQYANLGTATGTYTDMTVTDTDPSHYFGEMMMAPGTGTPGYWANHPNAWPVDSIVIGGVTYTKARAISLLLAPPAGDVTYILFRALVAAKLNVLVGNDASCIADTIAAADAWMATYGPVGSKVRANSAAWKIGEPLYKLLDDYNNGLLCAPSRDALEKK